MAQPGSAHAWGAWGRRFESCYSDHFFKCFNWLSRKLVLISGVRTRGSLISSTALLELCGPNCRQWLFNGLETMQRHDYPTISLSASHSDMFGLLDTAGKFDGPLRRRFTADWGRDLKFLVVAALVTVLACLASLSYAGRTYVSTSMMVIRSSDTMAGSTTVLAEQVQVLRSRSIARSVIGTLDLTSRREFDPAIAPPFGQKVFSSLGLTNFNTSVNSKERVLISYFSRLDIEPGKVPNSVAVSFRSANPQLARSVTDLIVDTYVDLQSKLNLQVTSGELALLQKQVDALRLSLMQAEADAAELRRSFNLLGKQDEPGVLADGAQSPASDGVPLGSTSGTFFGDWQADAASSPGGFTISVNRFPGEGAEGGFQKTTTPHEKLASLEAEAKTLRGLLEDATGRMQQARARQNIDFSPVDVHVLTRASVPVVTGFTIGLIPTACLAFFAVALGVLLILRRISGSFTARDGAKPTTQAVRHSNSFPAGDTHESAPPLAPNLDDLERQVGNNIEESIHSR